MEPIDAAALASLIILLVGLCFVTPAVTFFGFWTPWRNAVLNTVLRKLWPLRNLTTYWKVRGHWYAFTDRASSITLKIAYEEVCKGFYTPQVALRPGDVVLDIGAHVGMFTIPLAREHPQVRFFAYEPNAENYANLHHNVQRAGLENVTLVRAGVWGNTADLLNVQDRHNTGRSRTHAIATPAPTLAEPSEVCRGMTLDDIRATWNLGDIRVLKMDCEGAEYQALRSSHDLRRVDNLLLEVHGGDYPLMLALARRVPHHRIQVLRDSHLTIDSSGAWRPASLGAA